MQEYALGLLNRMREIIPHGMQKKVAQRTGISVSTLGRWGSKRSDKWQVPSVHEIVQVAQAVGCSPTWLAFGIGPKEPQSALMAQHLGKHLEADPELAHVVKAYLASPEHERANVRLWASKYPPPEMQEPEWTGATPAAATPKSPAQMLPPARQRAPLASGTFKEIYQLGIDLIRAMPEGTSASEAGRRICALLESLPSEPPPNQTNEANGHKTK